MTNPKPTAEDAYQQAHFTARNLLERISELLSDMPAPGNDDYPIHWGHVGDIGHINDLLLQIATFLEKRG